MEIPDLADTLVSNASDDQSSRNEFGEQGAVNGSLNLYQRSLEERRVGDSQNNNRQKIGSCLLIVDAHVYWVNALFHLHGHQDPRGALSLLDSLRQKIRFRQDGRPRSVKTSRSGFKNNGPNNRDHTEHQGCC